MRRGGGVLVGRRRGVLVGGCSARKSDHDANVVWPVDSSVNVVSRQRPPWPPRLERMSVAWSKRMWLKASDGVHCTLPVTARLGKLACHQRGERRPGEA